MDEMQSTLQHVYATNLKQKYGYPLRNPQPDIALGEPYETEGLQIGDIGYVDEYGQFNLLFNVKFPPSEYLGWVFPPGEPGSVGSAQEVLPHEPTPSHNSTPVPSQGTVHVQPHAPDLRFFDRSTPKQALDPNRVFKMGVTKDGVGDSRTEEGYRFTAAARAGAILILPDGAKLAEIGRQYLKHILDHIAKYASEWCSYADRDSLYLLTAVYKAKSWALGSFDEGLIGGKIHVYPDDKVAPAIFTWDCTFEMDSQQAFKGNNDLNQAVFIKGFKMTVRDQKILMVKRFPELSEGWLARLFSRLRSNTRKWIPGSSIRLKYLPALNFSEPSHPLDIVNHILLNENPRAQMAITHDDDWIDMLENGLSLENLMEEGPLRDCMERTYRRDFEHDTVCLRRISGGEADHFTHYNYHGEEIDSNECKPDNCPEAPEGNPRLVIAHMRLESFDVDHVDAGVCILVQIGTTTRRTVNKPHAEVIEWGDEITLPSDGPVHITVCGTFQLGSTLGTRQISEEQTINISDTFRGASPSSIRFSFGPRSSLLITLERHFSCCDTHLSHEDNPSPEFVQTASRGFKNFYSYHRGNKEHLDAAIECFRCVLEHSGSDPECRATARFGLAASEVIRCQAKGAYSELEEATKLFREALSLCSEGHPDRPATLLLLAQALLSRHGDKYDEFVVEEIENLLAEFPPDNSRNRRSADAILATCRLYRAADAADPAKVDCWGLVVDLERGACAPLYGYFDRLHLSHKLGVTFWRRFRATGDLDDLDKSIDLNSKALQVPDGHDNRTYIAACLASSLICAFQARRELSDVNLSVGLADLGGRVITMLDGVSYAEGVKAPSEDLKKQIDLRFAVAKLQKQIEFMSSVEEVRERAAHSTNTHGGSSPRISEVEGTMVDWSRDEGALTECKRQLGVLLSFLGGEGDRKMRQALIQAKLEWPYKEHKIVVTMLALEKHIPYLCVVPARRLKFVMKGWS